MAVFYAPDAAEEQRIADQQRMAQALLSSGMQDAGRTQMAGNIAIKNSPWQGISQMMNAYLGGKLMNQSQQQSAALEQKRRQEAAEILKNGFSKIKSGDNYGAMETFASNKDTEPYARALLNASLRPEKSNELTPYQQEMLKLQRDRLDFQRNKPDKPTDKYHPPVATSSGYLVYDDATGAYKPLMDDKGKPYMPTAADVGLAQNRSTANQLGKAGGDAAVQFGGMQNAVNEIDIDLDRMRTHPGLEGITGIRGAIPNIPGTDAADAQAMLEKLQGGVFLQARQALKGGGQVTDYEGQKAEQAYGRMQKAQSKEAFLQALDDYQTHIHKGLEILSNQAQGNFGTPTSVSKYRVGQIIEHGGKKYRVTGGDMNDPDLEPAE